VHDEIPPELNDKAALVVANCPEFAIGIADDDAANRA